MWSLSFLSSLRADIWFLVRLGLRGWEDLRTLLILALSSSASCWLSLVQAVSMAVMYSKLGGCLGVTAKLGPLARTDLWAGVKGLLERLMTHLGLGSSLEEPWGCLAGGSGVIAFPGGSMNLLGGLGGPLPWGLPATLPKIICWIISLTCLGVRGVRRSPVFWWRQESSRLGGKGGNDLGKTGIFPGQDRVVPAWGGAPPSLAWLLACKSAGEVLASLWGGTCLGRPVVFPGGHLGDYLTVSLRIVIVIMIIIIWISIRPCYISFLSDS